MPYRFVEDVSLADVAFEATGKTLEELFESAAIAVTHTMVRDVKSVSQKIKKDFVVKSDKIDMLLFNFLQEIIFYKDAERLLFSKFDIKVNMKPLEASCTAHGEELDMKRHELVVDVKAVTLHKFGVEQTEDGWRAEVVLDI